MLEISGANFADLPPGMPVAAPPPTAPTGAGQAKPAAAPTAAGQAKPAAAPTVAGQAKPAAAPVIEHVALVKVDPERMAHHLGEVAMQLNQQLARHNVSVGFYIDAITGHPVMTLRSTVSGDVLREIPGHVAQAVAHSIEQFKGMLLNRKA